MRIRIAHDTTYRYGSPVKSAIQAIRLTPRDHDGQFVSRWNIDIDGDARVVRREDWFGNIVHGLTIDGPVEQISIKVTGEVETEDHSGLVRGTVERFPPALFLRETRLTASDAAIEEFARAAAPDTIGMLDRMHGLMNAINAKVRFDIGSTNVVTTAIEAFGADHGVCQDLAHIFCAGARSLGIPARYVSGYLYKPGESDQEASHAWAEAYIEDLGWVSFDPANAVGATEGYVRIAIGLDYIDAAPVKGSFYGAAQESMDVRLKIDSARQSQA